MAIIINKTADYLDYYRTCDDVISSLHDFITQNNNAPIMMLFNAFDEFSSL